MIKLKKGLFITIEGIDGSGKTSQSDKLFIYLKDKGYPVVKTREPGGTDLSEKLRDILLNPENRIFPWTELLIYGASRRQHTEEVIIPALNNCKIVICDRYKDATLAYQGYGRGLDLEKIVHINDISSNGLLPDLTILFDIDLQTGLKRRGIKGLDRLEKEDISFHKRVRDGYLKIAQTSKDRVKKVEVQGNIEKVFKKAQIIIDEFLIKQK